MRLLRLLPASRVLRVVLAAFGLRTIAAAILLAGPLPLPNGSFESPSTNFVAVSFDSWQKTPKPAWFTDTVDDQWVQKIGTFANTSPTSSDHIDNLDGKDALYLFNVPEVGLFQDFDSVDYNDPAPTHAFNAVYEPGKFYSLTVGICGLGGGMPFGVTLDISLYYRDAAGNRVPVATTTVVHTAASFPNHTHFVDFHVHVPVVQPTDPWAGKHIGIQFLSTVDLEDEGGYWDLDNVRLASGPDPVALTRDATNANLAWYSIAGYQYQLQSSDNLVDWNNEGGPVPGTDATLSQTYALASHSRRFFRTVISALP